MFVNDKLTYLLARPQMTFQNAHARHWHQHYEQGSQCDSTKVTKTYIQLFYKW